MPMHLLQYIFAYDIEYRKHSTADYQYLVAHHIYQIINNQLGQMEVNFTREELQNAMFGKDFFSAFKFIYQDLSGGRRLFFKENLSYRFMDAILHHFPDVRFVIQVRDPRDFALSMVQRSTDIHNIMAATKVWRRDQTHAKRVLNNIPQRCHLIKYEDLLTHPRQTLRGLCNFLEMNYEEALLNFNQKTDALVASKRSKSWENLSKGILSDNQLKYRKAFSKREIKIIETIISDLITDFDYEREHQPQDSFIYKFIREFGDTPLQKYMAWFLPGHKKKKPYPEEMERRRALKALRLEIARERRSYSVQH